MTTTLPADAAATPAEVTAGAEPVTKAESLSRLDVYVDHRPVDSLDVSDGDHVVRLPSDGASPRRVDLRGFANGELAAARRLEV